MVTGVYLIVHNQFIVAQDIALTIADHDPAAEVLVAGDAGEGLAECSRHGRIAVAFVSSDPADFDGSALALALGDRGARVVLMGDGAEQAAASLPWAVLHRPFTAGAVADLLRQPA